MANEECNFRIDGKKETKVLQRMRRICQWIPYVPAVRNIQGGIDVSSTGWKEGVRDERTYLESGLIVFNFQVHREYDQRFFGEALAFGLWPRYR
jgi:hypothetical protein